jgi:hypothetical protein
MSEFPKDYFTPRRVFERQLREYCWDTANLESNEDVLLKEAKLVEKTSNTTFSDALQAAVEKRPELAEPRTLEITPPDVLYNLAESAGGDLIEAVALVKAKNPDLVRLDELYQDNPNLFEAACERAGKQSGKFAATDKNIVAKVLQWSECVSEEIENADWPHDPKTGEKLTVDQILRGTE